MEYNTLLDVASELGYALAMSGAETYRVEESINRVLAAYGVESEAFAIPNCLHVTIRTAEHLPITRMRRIGTHGNDLDAVELLSALSRRICTETPDPQLAMQWLEQTRNSVRHYCRPLIYLAYFFGAFGFTFLFGGALIDGICAGLCGLCIAVIDHYSEDLNINPFFKLIVSACIATIPAVAMAYWGICRNADAAIIGALMLLVPGLLFTNAMRDIIYGDINSGTNRVVQVFLIAVAIALGTGVVINASNAFWGPIPVEATPGCPILIQFAGCFVACIAFAALFNAHGLGTILCALGGLLSWGVFLFLMHLGMNDIVSYFGAAVVSSAFAEITARIRKYPAISYLVISIFPLIPGASTYYTMTYAVQGDTQSFASQGLHTIAIAGVIALGILLVSSCFRAAASHKCSAVKVK